MPRAHKQKEHDEIENLARLAICQAIGRVPLEVDTMVPMVDNTTANKVKERAHQICKEYFGENIEAFWGL
jgi:hypothetical protein